MAMGIRRPDFNWENMLKRWIAATSNSPMSEEEDEKNSIEQSTYDDMDDEYNLAEVFDAFDALDRVQRIGFNLLIGNNPKEIDHVVTTGTALTAEEYEDLLVELQELAEYVDITKQLHLDNQLGPLLHKVLSYKYDAGLYNKHAAVRAKAAEVVTTMVHNNPSSQQLVMEVNGLKPLLDNFISDPDGTARNKALVAISSLVRNNKPGIAAFLLENGYATLRDALSSDTKSVMFQREALNLIQYLLHENSLDCNIVTQLGFPRIMMHLTSSNDALVREAALRGLLVLARDEGGQLVRNDDKLKQVLQERIEIISAMAPEDLGAAKEERQLVDSLWNACYNEPPSLGEKGLLVLPGC